MRVRCCQLRLPVVPVASAKKARHGPIPTLRQTGVQQPHRDIAHRLWPRLLGSPSPAVEPMVQR